MDKDPLTEVPPSPEPMPDAWFDGLYEGNARYPFTSAFPTLFITEAVLAEGTEPDMVGMKIRKKRFSVSEDQRNRFMKGLRIMHELHGVMKAPEGTEEAHAEAVRRRFPKHVRIVSKTFTPEGLETLANDVLRDVPKVLGNMHVALAHDIQDAKVRNEIIKAFVTIAADVARHNPQIKTLTDAHIRRLSIISTTTGISTSGSDPNRDADTITTRRSIFDTFEVGIAHRLRAHPMFKSYTSNQIEALTIQLTKEWGPVFQI